MILWPHLWEILSIHLFLITKITNLSFGNGRFSKYSTIFKKNDDLDKENYRHVIVLFNVSNVYERII